MELFDRRIRTEADLERLLDVPILAAIPDAGASRHPGLVRSRINRAFFRLSAALRYLERSKMRTISVVSPFSGDGKTTVALNTAVALADMTGSVLLVDADLCKPALHLRLGCAVESGLANVLEEKLPLEAALQSTGHLGLDFMSAGNASRNPLYLLQSSRFERVCRQLGEQYQFVVFDGPAIAESTGALSLANATSGSIVVVSAGSADDADLLNAIKLLKGSRGINLIGSVLNRADIGRGTRPDSYAQIGSLPLASSDEHAVSGRT